MNDINKDEIDARWHMLVWRMMIVICSISFVISWILFGVYRVDKSIGAGAYIVKYIVLPMIVQAIAITICYFYMKHDEADIKHKNYVVTGMIYVCVGVIAFTYCTIYPLILIPCVTIIATALFADQELTVWSGVAVLALMVINVVRLHLNVGELATQMNWVGALLIYILVVSVMCAMVMVVNKHTKALMESIAGSYNRQVTLMSELMVDPMTGLYNRRSFEESLDKEIENVEQTGAKSYVTIFDIDHFKEVNDTYGHSNGDIVIKALCKMMKEKSKDMGLAFRYGGEEFVILFHDVELSKVMNVVEDIRTEFRCYYFHFMNKDGITCSCGVAEYTKGESSNLTGVLLLGVNEGAYFHGIESSVLMPDVTEGFIKSFVFALLIALICCYQGYNAHRRRDGMGPEAVANATTSAVVISCVFVLVADYVVTSAMLR